MSFKTKTWNEHHPSADVCRRKSDEFKRPEKKNPFAGESKGASLISIYF
jgi:hypothetical protein